MIIVTGCDNTGKTSLIKKISSELGIPVATKCKYGPPVTQKEWMKWYDWCYEQLNCYEDKIYDRLFIDELVYGPAVRGKYDIPNMLMADLSNLLLIRQPLYIYTVLPREAIKKTYADRDQYPKIGHVDKILDRFNVVNNSYPVSLLLHKMEFNYLDDPDYSKILFSLREHPEYYKGGTNYHG